MNKKSRIGVFIAAGVALISGVCISGCSGKSKSMPLHEHTYGESVWAQDDTAHWHAATCGHGVRKDYGKHVYDDDADADCNVCGRIREIKENTDPAESNGEKPKEEEGNREVEPAGFIISPETDGLVVEGVSEEYALSRTNRALNFDTLAYKVYLSEKGEKGEEVPRENYETKVYYGGKEVEKPQELTEDGQYAALVTLVGAYYENGGSVAADEVAARINFKIDNGVESITLTGGKTEQVSSERDKMSGSWTYEAVRANGDTEAVDGSEVELQPPDTETVGTHTTTVKYGGAESEIEYTVNPVPEIVSGGVDITAKESLDRQTDGEYAEIGVDDFNVEYAAAAEYDYSVETTLFYEGVTAKSVKFKADGKTRSVTVRVTFNYCVEGEKISREYSKEFQITVNKKSEENSGVVSLNGAEIAGGAGEVSIDGQADFTAVVNGTALEIRYSGDEFGGIYNGLKIRVDGAATVKIRMTVSSGALAGLMQDGAFGDGQEVEGEVELTFEFTKEGEYETYIILSDFSDAIIIHGAEIIYGQ